MNRRTFEQFAAEDERRQFAELERTAAPAIYVVVFDFQGERQRFWSGKRPVTEYPDAAEFRSFGKGKAALGSAAAYFKGQTASLVENYGDRDERVVLTAQSETNPNWRNRGVRVSP